MKPVACPQIGPPLCPPQPPAILLAGHSLSDARLCFRPPRSATSAAGPLPFQVKVVGSAEPYAPTLAGGVAEVAPFNDLSVA